MTCCHSSKTKSKQTKPGTLIASYIHCKCSSPGCSCSTSSFFFFQVEWMYAFDIHCNSFFPLFLLLYVLQFFLLPFLLNGPFFPPLFHFFFVSLRHAKGGGGERIFEQERKQSSSSNFFCSHFCSISPFSIFFVRLPFLSYLSIYFF